MEGFTFLGFEEEDAPRITRFEKFKGIEHGEINERTSQGGEAKAWEQYHTSCSQAVDKAKKSKRRIHKKNRDVVVSEDSLKVFQSAE